MYRLKKRIEISASHSLCLDYDSKCKNIHGHNWIITLYCQSESLDKNGMIIDFGEIKKRIKDQLDHKNLNEVLPFNPTAENIAKWCVDQIESAYKCEVQESEGNTATFEI